MRKVEEKNTATFLEVLMETLNKEVNEKFVILTQTEALAVLAFYYGRMTALSDVARGELFRVYDKSEEAAQDERNVQYALAIHQVLGEQMWDENGETDIQLCNKE